MTGEAEEHHANNLEEREVIFEEKRVLAFTGLMSELRSLDYNSDNQYTNCSNRKKCAESQT